MPPKTKIGAKTDVKTKVALSVGMVAAVAVGAFFVNVILNSVYPLSVSNIAASCTGYRLGDVTKDGKINEADNNYVRYAFFSSFMFRLYPCADQNNDGIANAADMTIVGNQVISCALNQSSCSGNWPYVIPSCNNSFQLGDVDKSLGKANGTDIQVVENIIVNKVTFSKFNYPCADINNDGYVNDADLFIVKRCAVLQPSSCVGKYWPGL